MELIECKTCGSHSFTNGKCDYCGNQYEVKQDFMKELKIAPLSDYMKSLTEEELKDIYNNLKDGLTPNQIRTATCKEDLVKKAYGKTYCDDGAEAYAQDFHEYTSRTEVTELGFKDTPEGKSLLKIMIWVLISIIWFAVCVFIPPLFIITICGLIIWVCRKVCKKY